MAADQPVSGPEDTSPSVRRRAARIVSMVQGEGRAPRAAMPDDIDVDAILRGIDMLLPRIVPVADPTSRIAPPTYRAPWFRPQPVDPMLGGPEFGLDDPEALLAAGPLACGTAFGQLCEEGLLAWRRSSREIAARALRWLDRDGGRFEPLEVALGLKPGKSWSYYRSLATRDSMLVDLARMMPYADMAPHPAASAIRTAGERFQAVAWPRHQKGRTTPSTDDRLAHVFYQIGRLDLSPWWPNETSLARMITADRTDH